MREHNREEEEDVDYYDLDNINDGDEHQNQLSDHLPLTSECRSTINSNDELMLVNEALTSHKRKKENRRRKISGN